MSRHSGVQAESESDGSEGSETTSHRRRRKDHQALSLNTASQQGSSREVNKSVMSKDRLPLIGSHDNRSAVRPVLSTLQRPPQPARRKRIKPPLPYTALPDSMAPWEGPSLFESSFTSIPPPPPPPPPAPPAPTANPSPDPQTPLKPIKLTQPDSGQSMRPRRRPLPPRRPPRPPRLPPLRPVTNLSFSRSFTFSFFELPLHQSAHVRAERLRELMLLLRQIQY